MSGWDVALFTAAAYIAVIAMVRLMRRHHDRRQADLRQHVEQEKRRIRLEKRKAELQTAAQQASRPAA
jgi:hypothetical protein